LATRDDILDELGLAPRWRLRARVQPSVAAVALADVPLDRAARIGALAFEALAEDIAACTACGLCRTRARAVPGVGDARAEWMFIGEAPGAEEDARG